MTEPDSTAARSGRGKAARASAPAAFRQDPLTFLRRALNDEELRSGPVDALWFAPGRLLVVEAEAARDVLANRGDRYREHSDFFFTRQGAPGPRSAQVRIGRDARTLLQHHHETRAGRLSALIERRLAPVSRWPDAGNHLIHAYLGTVLVRPDAAPAVRRTVDRVVERAVLATARERHSALSRFLLRTELHLRLGAELTRRQRRGTGEQADLLDVVADGGLDAPVEQLVEVYLSFVFALVGSLGFALGWSVYLLGTGDGAGDHGQSNGADHISWVVHEALRLWPVAWLFGRWPSRPHRIAGVDVGPSDEVNVCTWLLHRNPRNWDRPELFRPERWADTGRNPAYLPFGFGPHACAGAGIAVRILQDLVRPFASHWHVTVTPCGGQPHIGAALAPPPYTVTLDPGRR